MFETELNLSKFCGEQIPMDFRLPAGVVHVWIADVNTLPPEILSPLSGEERTRMARFSFAADRQRYGVARGLLRLLVGQYLNLSPETLAFQINAAGKPSIKDPVLNHLCQFNLSHSQHLALFAFTAGAPVGVDAEWIKPGFEFRDIVERFFFRAEKLTMEGLSEKEQVDWFFRQWTIKEAVLKAAGRGLGEGLDQITFSDSGQGRGQAILGDDPATLYQIFHFTPEKNFTAALAVPFSPTKIQYFHLPTEQASPAP